MLWAMSANAPTQDGYQQVVSGHTASLNAFVYLGLNTIRSYDALGCASLSDPKGGCMAFNMYIERDPSVDPNDASCANPSGITNYKCTLWGSPVSSGQATNHDEHRNSLLLLRGRMVFLLLVHYQRAVLMVMGVM